MYLKQWKPVLIKNVPVFWRSTLKVQMYEDYFISTKKKQKKVKTLYDKSTL